MFPKTTPPTPPNPPPTSQNNAGAATATAAATTPWSLAVMLLTRWLENSERVDALLETLPPAALATGVERARCQSLLYGAIRHKGRVEAQLRKLIPRSPRPRLKAILLVAGYELLDAPAITAVAAAKAASENLRARPPAPKAPSKAAARAARAQARADAKAAEEAEADARATRAGHIARVVHHAVEQTKTLASGPEAGLVNAVARKLGALLSSEPPPPKFADAVQLATWYSHPVWLVQRWLAQFGALEIRPLLEWNQRPAPVYARWRARATPAFPSWLTPTAWENFHEVQPGHWPEVEAAIASGDLYLQDPSTRLAIDLLAPRAGERILDACAAPGGKTLAIADKVAAQLEPQPVAPAPDSPPPLPDIPDLSDRSDRSDRSAQSARSLESPEPSAAEPPTPATAAAAPAPTTAAPAATAPTTAAPAPAPASATHIVALDLPTARIDRLKQNLSRAPANAALQLTLLEGDLLHADASLFCDRALPAEYDAVLLDAPCSNTGVMRHRVDVKWRLQSNDFAKHARQQLALLEAAARRVAAGGRLVYSTCSIDAEENQKVIAAFLKTAPDFALENSVIAHPWTAAHDGAAAFLLRRQST